MSKRLRLVGAQQLWYLAPTLTLSSCYHQGHDLRYALDGNKMRELGWAPDTTVVERLRDVTTWTLQNDRWL